MKKLFLILSVMILCIGIFVGCTTAEKDITVISRESGSGTRGAFEELLKLEAKDVQSSLEMNSTNNVMTEVSNNKNAIGYISLGSLNDSIKALNINDVVCSADNVKNGTYALARPFEVVYNKTAQKSAIAIDFEKFLVSKQAQEIITANGYISIGAGEDYTAQESMTGTLNITGSTSVGPLMNKLFAEYKKLNPSVEMNMTESGSGPGISDASQGTVDFGMSSREIKASELEKVGVINLCKDGIAVIVNKNNELTNITTDNLAKIYKKEIKKFSEIK